MKKLLLVIATAVGASIVKKNLDRSKTSDRLVGRRDRPQGRRPHPRHHRPHATTN
jgi:hypothetical protein